MGGTCACPKLTPCAYLAPHTLSVLHWSMAGHASIVLRRFSHSGIFLKMQKIQESSCQIYHRERIFLLPGKLPSIYHHHPSHTPMSSHTLYTLTTRRGSLVCQYTHVSGGTPRLIFTIKFTINENNASQNIWFLETKQPIQTHTYVSTS
jgi:hypothetical protein